MRRKRKVIFDWENDENLINLTPLIDVVFVVLISFILIAPLLEVDHIDLAHSPHQSDKNITNTSIVLKVKEDNSILLNNRLITLNELGSLIKEIKKAHPNQVPQIYHDKKAYFGTFQSIKNIIEATGFEQLDVVLQPD